MRILLRLPDYFLPSSSWHQTLRKNFDFALVDYLFQAFPSFKYALGDICCMKILIYYRNFEKKIKTALLMKQNERQVLVLHCNVTVAAWRHENTRDVSAASQHSGKTGGEWKQFSAEIFWSGPMTSWFCSIFQCVTTSFCLKTTEMVVLS